MKYIFVLLTLLSVAACQKKEPGATRQFKAVKDGEVALLTITETETTFQGQFELHYDTAGKDHGKVEGVIIGDTLKGRYTYISYGGRNEIRPFVLLKSGDNYKYGTGQAADYMNIPYITPETLRFDNSFLFEPLAN